MLEFEVHQSLANPEELFERNRKLALKFARPYLDRFPAMREEIEQVAYLGLWEAILRWDPEKGALSTLASFWVRAQVQELLRRTLSPLTLGDEIIKEMVAGNRSISVLRLDEEVREGEEGDYHDLIPSSGNLPWEEAEAKEEREVVGRFLEGLPEKDRLLLKALHGFYGRRFSEKEMAAFFGTSVRALRRRLEGLYARAREEIGGV